MKKLIVIISLLVYSLSMNAQIFSYKRLYDKFDDVIKAERRKSIVDYDDPFITIEEKGRKPQLFLVLRRCDEDCAGSKTNIVNLTKDVYGYQETWLVIRDVDMKKYDDIEQSAVNGDLDVDEGVLKMSKYWLYMTHRVITTQYSHEYKTEYWWIQDPSTGRRTIYAMQ